MRQRRLVLVTCCLALFISTLDNTIANVALPSIGRDLGASSQALQWVIASYIVVRGCLLLSAGALADRLGRRRVFLTGIAIFGIGSLLCSVAPSVDLLIAARVLQAIGGCVLVPASLAILTDAYPERRERAWAIGVWSGTAGVSNGLGPVIGGALVTLTDWRSVFWINIPFVLTAIWLTVRHVPESEPLVGRRLDLPGQTAVLVLLVTVTSACIESSSSGWTSPTALSLFAFALVALVAFLIAESRGRDMLLPLHLFRSASFSGAAALATIVFALYAGFLFVNTLYLQEVLGYSPVAAGGLMIATTIGNIFLSPLSGKMTADRGPRLPVVIASLLLLAGSLTLALSVSTSHAELWRLLLGYVLIGSGVGLLNAPITVAAVAGLPNARAGVGGAITSTFRQIGNSLGVAVLGSLAFTGYAGALPSKVGATGLDPSTTDRIVEEARRAGASGGLAGHVQGGTAATTRAIGEAYGVGLTHAYVGAVVLAAISIVIGLTCFNRGLGGSAVGEGRPTFREAPRATFETGD